MPNNEFESWRPALVRIVAELRREGVDVDRLPYTERFEELYAAAGGAISRQDFFWQLIVIRKNFKRYAEKYAQN